MIGAGSVVTRDVPDFGLVIGNPAEIRGFICRCGQSLPLTFSGEGGASSSCGLHFRKTGKSVILVDAKVENMVE